MFPTILLTFYIYWMNATLLPSK